MHEDDSTSTPPPTRFDDSAAAIDDDVDPRAAIIAAYARLLDGSPRPAARGWRTRPRRSTCAAASSRSACRPRRWSVVVDKFLVARFSTHPLTEADRDEVRAALRAAGRQLRDAVVAAARRRRCGRWRR